MNEQLKEIIELTAELNQKLLDYRLDLTDKPSVLSIATVGRILQVQLGSDAVNTALALGEAPRIENRGCETYPYQYMLTYKGIELIELIGGSK